MRMNKPSRKIRIKKKKKKGKNKTISLSFIVYVIVGILILGFLYYAIFVHHEKNIQKVKLEKINNDMDRICLAALIYFQEHAQFPTNDQGLKRLTRDYLNHNQEDSQTSRKGYLDQIPLDPWGNRYSYEYSKTDEAIILRCWGNDGKPGGAGDAADIIRNGCPPTIMPGMD